MVGNSNRNEILLIDTSSAEQHRLEFPDWLEFQSISWSPDGKSLYASGEKDLDTSFSIVRIPLADPKPEVLFQVPAGSAWIVAPLPSPDGRHLVFNERIYENSVVLLENF